MPAPATPITGALTELWPLAIQEVSPAPQRAERAVFAALIHHHHYLSHRSTVGENLQYLVRDRAGRPRGGEHRGLLSALHY